MFLRKSWDLSPLGITDLLTVLQTLWSLLTTDAVRTRENNTHDLLRNRKGCSVDTVVKSIVTNFLSS